MKVLKFHGIQPRYNYGSFYEVIWGHKTRTDRYFVQMLMIPRLGGIKFDDTLTHHRDSEKGSGQGQSQGQIKNKNRETDVPWQHLPDDTLIEIKRNGRK